MPVVKVEDPEKERVMFEAAISRLETGIGHRFARRELIRQALTHSSFAKEAGKGSYERLEFLGDRVVELAVSEWLYENRSWDEGELSKALSWLVDEASLAEAAHRAGIDSAIRLGRSYAGRTPSPSVMADSFESFVGAVYVDSDFRTASRVVVMYLLKDGEIGEPPAGYFSRSLLEEHCQRLGIPAPSFTYAEGGPDHEKSFDCSVLIQGGMSGKGTGRTKKEAERMASTDLLAKMSRPA